MSRWTVCCRCVETICYLANITRTCPYRQPMHILFIILHIKKQQMSYGIIVSYRKPLVSLHSFIKQTSQHNVCVPLVHAFSWNWTGFRALDLAQTISLNNTSSCYTARQCMPTTLWAAMSTDEESPMKNVLLWSGLLLKWSGRVWNSNFLKGVLSAKSNPGSNPLQQFETKTFFFFFTEMHFLRTFILNGFIWCTYCLALVFSLTDGFWGTPESVLCVPSVHPS